MAHAESPSTSRRITPETESCDCGGEYPCSHGDWLYGVRLAEPKAEIAERYGTKREPVPDYAFSYSEVCEFPDWLATQLLLSTDLVASLRRTADALSALVHRIAEPGSESHFALGEARALLEKLDMHPVELAWDRRDEGSAA